jgi:hypothetical protein
MKVLISSFYSYVEYLNIRLSFSFEHTDNISTQLVLFLFKHILLQTFSPRASCEGLFQLKKQLFFRARLQKRTHVLHFIAAYIGAQNNFG